MYLHAWRYKVLGTFGIKNIEGIKAYKNLYNYPLTRCPELGVGGFYSLKDSKLNY